VWFYQVIGVVLPRNGWCCFTTQELVFFYRSRIGVWFVAIAPVNVVQKTILRWLQSAEYFSHRRANYETDRAWNNHSGRLNFDAASAISGRSPAAAY
jgi:hypothetical protein